MDWFNENNDTYSDIESDENSKAIIKKQLGRKLLEIEKKVLNDPELEAELVKYYFKSIIRHNIIRLTYDITCKGMRSVFKLHWNFVEYCRKDSKNEVPVDKSKANLVEYLDETFDSLTLPVHVADRCIKVKPFGMSI